MATLAPLSSSCGRKARPSIGRAFITRKKPSLTRTPCSCSAPETSERTGDQYPLNAATSSTALADCRSVLHVRIAYLGTVAAAARVLAPENDQPRRVGIGQLPDEDGVYRAEDGAGEAGRQRQREHCGGGEPWGAQKNARRVAEVVL